MASGQLSQEAFVREVQEAVSSRNGQKLLQLAYMATISPMHHTQLWFRLKAKFTGEDKMFVESSLVQLPEYQRDMHLKEAIVSFVQGKKGAGADLDKAYLFCLAEKCYFSKQLAAVVDEVEAAQGPLPSEVKELLTHLIQYYGQQAKSVALMPSKVLGYETEMRSALLQGDLRKIDEVMHALDTAGLPTQAFLKAQVDKLLQQPDLDPTVRDTILNLLKI